MIIFALGRLWVSGDTDNPSRLYYSGAGTQIADFSVAYSGGWVDVSKNDGDEITGIAFYQNSIIITKARSVWRFTFTDDGLPKLELITNEYGCISFRTMRVVDNDLWWLARKDGRAMILSLGNVKNYFNTLRTVERSIEVSSDTHLGGVNISQLANASGYFYRNMYFVSVAQGGSTTNNRLYVYDSRFQEWVGYWDGIPANDFFTYVDDDGNEDLFYCSDETGYVVKMFTGTSDNGTAVNWRLKTKAYNQDRFDEYKIYRNPHFWFKDISGGSLGISILTDGVYESGNFSVSPLVSGVGAGFDLAGTVLAGTSLGSATNTEQSDKPVELLFIKQGRSIQFELSDNNASSDFLFLGHSFKYLLLEGKPLPAENRISLS